MEPSTEERLKELAKTVREGTPVFTGRALKEAKALVPHGEWLAWLRKHFRGSPRAAQRAMHNYEKDLAYLRYLNQESSAMDKWSKLSRLRRICKKRSNATQGSVLLEI